MGLAEGKKGVVAAGHEETVRSAVEVLAAGGNAFDAILGAFATASHAETILTSLGGGGFLTAVPANGKPRVYDFFVQTPKVKKPEADLDFQLFPINFGEAIQNYYGGAASIAVPGGVKAISDVHRDLGSIPLQVVLEPAIRASREGVMVNNTIDFLFNMFDELIHTTDENTKLFSSPKNPDKMIRTGEMFKNEEYAQFLERLAKEGDEPFYRGDIAEAIVDVMQDKGGYLTADDLASYEVIVRKPIETSFHGRRIILPPPPSISGVLLGFAFRLLEKVDLGTIEYRSAEYYSLLVETLKTINSARASELDHRILDPKMIEDFADDDQMDKYFRDYIRSVDLLGSTTHISIIDDRGNIASLTSSLGALSGYIAPGTGLLLNNMLGEEDLNPGGFHKWDTDIRMPSGMSPGAIIHPDGSLTSFGTGGSSRIRSALLHSILSKIGYKQAIDIAIDSSRVHLEEDLLAIEGGMEESVVAELQKRYPNSEAWGTKALYFGGVHIGHFNGDRGTFVGHGDPRRSGIAVV